MPSEPEEDVGNNGFDYHTVCSDPECAAQFYPDEEGFDYESCIECGADTYEEMGG